MAKLSAGALGIKKGKHNISELITVCCENAAKLLNSHTFKIQIEENLPLLDFDFSLIEILLSNLISNALEYSPPKSTVEIEARRYENTLILSIADEGKGIPQEMMDTIFEKFYRVPGTVSLGLGLGLSIAKTIAELHGGSLKAENRKTGGARVTLFLPIE
jgi:two-component system sensor histidine kinase KdpD